MFLLLCVSIHYTCFNTTISFSVLTKLMFDLARYSVHSSIVSTNLARKFAKLHSLWFPRVNQAPLQLDLKIYTKFHITCDTIAHLLTFGYGIP